MLHVLEGVRVGENHLLDQAFQLRRKVFVEELNWTNLITSDGKEIDQFDGVHAIYILAVRSGKVIGNLRLLPTALPHMLSTVRSTMCQRKYQTGFNVWEWSRFSIHKEWRGRSEVGDVATVILCGALEWGLENGVSEVITEFETFWITRFREFGFKVIPLGLPVEYDGKSYVAVHMQYDTEALNLMRHYGGWTQPIKKAVDFGRSITAASSNGMNRETEE